MKFKNIHLLMLCITAFFAMAGGAILAPALPDMVKPLQTTSQEVALLISGYTISTAIFTLVIGNFIDCMNRKKLLVPCPSLNSVKGNNSPINNDLFSLLLSH